MREKISSAWSQTFTKERSCSFWGKIFGWLCEGYPSGAEKDNTEIVRILYKFLFVCDFIPRALWSILFAVVRPLGKWRYTSVFLLILSDS